MFKTKIKVFYALSNVKNRIILSVSVSNILCFFLRAANVKCENVQKKNGASQTTCKVGKLNFISVGKFKNAKVCRVFYIKK